MKTLVAIALLLSACATTTHWTWINQSPTPMRPRPASSVEMFTSGAPARAHVDIGYLEAETGGDRETGEMIQALKEHAGHAGCDGMVLGGTSSTVNFDITLGVNSWKEVRATCIMWIAEGSHPAPMKPGEAEGAECKPAPGMPGAFSCSGELVCRDGHCVRESASR